MYFHKIFLLNTNWPSIDLSFIHGFKCSFSLIDHILCSSSNVFKRINTMIANIYWLFSISRLCTQCLINQIHSWNGPNSLIITAFLPEWNWGLKNAHNLCKVSRARVHRQRFDDILKLCYMLSSFWDSVSQTFAVSELPGRLFKTQISGFSTCQVSYL